MNKRIFSLVCILFYVFMAVSIYCSEQKSDQSKTYGLRSRIIRAFKKTKRSNKKNDIESQRENQLNNNNNNDDEANFKFLKSEEYKNMDYLEPCCCGLFYRYNDPDNPYNSHSLCAG
ncbi:fam-c protein [Plasmodium vinckei brucechwatti]|uniref:Fam-c protein n=1 Tax=Plasmodium vinckei brucechwatti TaxID=119398 RepID=A0A6V7SDV1_PLAVN|nr:fam-c protein [Plasmodium vinckei brucechwatti]